MIGVSHPNLSEALEVTRGDVCSFLSILSYINFLNLKKLNNLAKLISFPHLNCSMTFINFNEEFKDKGLKVSVRVLAIILLVILIVLAIITFVKISKGEHVRFLGFEFNIPKKESPIFEQDKTKIDTPIVFRDSPKLSKTPVYVSKKTNATKKLKPIDTTNTQFQPQIQAKNVNTGVNLGQVGDNYVSNEKELTDADKLALLKFIETVKKEKNFDPTCIIMMSTPNTNGGKVASQIEDFLTSKGYKIGGSGTAIGSGTLRGIVIDKMNDCLSITVGVL